MGRDMKQATSISFIFVVICALVKAEEPVTTPAPQPAPTTSSPTTAPPLVKTDNGTAPAGPEIKPEADIAKTGASVSKGGVKNWQGLSPVCIFILTAVFHSLLY